MQAWDRFLYVYRDLIKNLTRLSLQVDPEEAQAVAIALASALATSSAIPFLYPIYYVALFLPRIADDDDQCRIKYGAVVWNKYCQHVPHKLIPGIY